MRLLDQSMFARKRPLFTLLEYASDLKDGLPKFVESEGTRGYAYYVTSYLFCVFHDLGYFILECK